MVFVKKDWKYGRAGRTPVTDDELDRIESGIEEAHGRVAAVDALTTGAGRLSDASLRAAFEGRILGLSTPGGLAPLVAALDTGMSTGLQVLGDSTGNEAIEWPSLVASALGADYPAYRVKHWLWDDTAQDYAAPVTMQAGTGGDRRINFATQNAFLPSSAIIPTSTDLDVRIKASFDVWPPVANNALMTRGYTAGQYSFRFLVNTAGQVNLRFSADGTTNGFSTTYPVTGVVPGTPLWLRFTYDADNGAAQHAITFYQSADGVAWTTLGTNLPGGTEPLFASTMEWEIGAEGFNGSVLDGSIYDVEIRDGIGGRNLAPLLIDSWMLRSGATASRSGAPVLALVNGSHPGASITYLSDATRLPKMTPRANQAVCIVSCSHNDGNRTGGTYLADWDTLLTRAQAAMPTPQIVVTTQNPEGTAIATAEMHATRHWQITNWARRNGIPVVDAYQAFLDDSRGLAALLQGDSLHPNAAGSQVWAAEVLRVLGLS